MLVLDICCECGKKLSSKEEEDLLCITCSAKIEHDWQILDEGFRDDD